MSKLTPIATAAAILALSVSINAQAQQAAAEKEPEVVVVSGIRGSLQQSLSVKRNASSNVDVITAEDVGKMPDKNVADSLQRVPGVNISTSGAGSGGFDENDRVSMRGTAPSLTQTLINGHAVASGDWFVLDQVGGAVGRSASYSLLPSEIVGQVVVYKAPTADQIEGGSSGSIDIRTRHPLDFKQPISMEATVQAVYATLPEKTDPQVSALFNWKNEAGTLGLMVQGFSEKRSLRRDGQELLQWTQVAPTNAAVKTNPDLANVWFPRLIGSSLFQQERKRKGGLIDLQFKPSRDLSLEATYFRSKMDASNFNTNYMTDMNGSGMLGSGVAPDPGYVIRNGTLVSASFANKGTAAKPLRYGIVDDIVREGAYAQTEFFDLDAKWRATDKLVFTAKAGSTKGKGVTPSQGVFEGDINNSGASYQLNGLGSPANVKFPNIDVSKFTGTPLDWVFGVSPATTDDKETYGQIDAAFALDSGVFREIKFGVRGSHHTRANFEVAQGPNWSNTDVGGSSTNPAWSGTTYPGNFGKDLGGDFPKNVWILDPAVLNAWGDLHSNRDVSRTYYQDMFDLKENTKAIYVQGEMEGEGWSGNVGLRVVRTEGTSNGYQILQNQPVGGTLPAYPWGGFVQKTAIDNNSTIPLPSLNLKFDLRSDLVARVGLSRTMTRPDYGALGGAVLLTDETHTGNGGNAALKPVKSNNLDASLQWYFAPRALLSAGVFYMDLHDYVGYGVSTGTFIDSRASQEQKKPVFATYSITSPINVGAKVKGLELAAQVPVGMGYGFDANATFADSHLNFGACPAMQTATSGDPCDMLGASKTTANAGVYYENDKFNVRLSYAWRSAFLAAQDRGTPLYQDASGTVSASFNYNISKNIVLTLSGQNLNNPILKNYIYNKDQPARFYANGAQYYAGLHIKY
ncbi:TonB-dependent receptor [Rugamonas sp. FT82W]|uniref:TonB-dependent receptor n=1 Tax=Duganella vulcania TaxID=2692166 RepID=A0A845G0W2_9BURK|nr:TonB-dependent receptor [Duganella vulcania]MYM86667.1 TonB-dependent receptor [Duganella vulcania]